MSDVSVGVKIPRQSKDTQEKKMAATNYYNQRYHCKYNVHRISMTDMSVSSH